MKTNRILLSDKHFHQIKLAELHMGVILHALDVLQTAFSMEPQYRAEIQLAALLVREEFKKEATVESE